MPVRTNGGVFNDQMITGSLHHFVLEGADFSGAVDSYGQPVAGSAAEIIFTNISEEGFIDIMNPNSQNISFALEINRSDWDANSLTEMVQSLGTDVGTDHINCSLCTVTEVPYIFNVGGGGASSFIQLSDVPSTYSGSANYAVTVNSSATGLIFTPIPTEDRFQTISVASEPTINASGGDTLTFIAGSGITLSTDPVVKSIRIDSTGSSSSSDYIGISPGTTMAFSLRYYVTSAGTVYLPLATGSGKPAGTSVTVTKPAGTIVFIDITSSPDIISTDLGTTNSLEFDATQEVIFVFDGTSTWNLQIGATE